MKFARNEPPNAVRGYRYEDETHRMRRSILALVMLKFLFVFVGLENIRILNVSLITQDTLAFSKLIFVLSLVLAYRTFFYFRVVVGDRVRNRGLDGWESPTYDFFILFFPLFIGLLASCLAWNHVSAGLGAFLDIRSWQSPPCIFGLGCFE